MIAAVMTALVKTEIGPTPGFIVTAPVMGSGKGKFADLVSIVKTGRKTPMQTMPQDRNKSQSEVRFSGFLDPAGNPRGPEPPYDHRLRQFHPITLPTRFCVS